MMLSSAAQFLLAFSGGGGNGQRPSSSSDALVQTCDALSLCGTPPHGVCPSGMTAVAPPERSYTYTLRTADSGNAADDPKYYVPGELMPLYLRVVKRQIQGKADRGQTILRNESAKYIGLLLYAVRSGDESEAKVGDWELLLEERQKFWLPPDEPGCSRKAVMHAGPESKNFLECASLAPNRRASAEPCEPPVSA